MIPEKMKSKLTDELEFWNAGLIQELKFNYETTMYKMIVSRMKGIICFAHQIELISNEEKAELYYIYFNEEI